MNNRQREKSDVRETRQVPFCLSLLVVLYILAVQVKSIMFFLFTLFGGAVNVGYKDTSISTILFFTFYLASNDFFFFFLVPVYSLIFIQGHFNFNLSHLNFTCVFSTPSFKFLYWCVFYSVWSSFYYIQFLDRYELWNLYGLKLNVLFQVYQFLLYWLYSLNNDYRKV